MNTDTGFLACLKAHPLHRPTHNSRSRPRELMGSPLAPRACFRMWSHEQAAPAWTWAEPVMNGTRVQVRSTCECPAAGAHLQPRRCIPRTCWNPRAGPQRRRASPSYCQLTTNSIQNRTLTLREASVSRQGHARRPSPPAPVRGPRPCLLQASPQSRGAAVVAGSSSHIRTLPL